MATRIIFDNWEVFATGISYSKIILLEHLPIPTTEKSVLEYQDFTVSFISGEDHIKD